MEMQNTRLTYLPLIEGLLEKSEIRHAVNALLDLDQKTQAGLRQDIIQQSGNFEEAQKSLLRGVVSYDEYNRNVARVRFALLDLLKELPGRLSSDDQLSALQSFQFDLPEDILKLLTDPADPLPKKEEKAIEKPVTVEPKAGVASPLSSQPKFVIVNDLADSAQCQLLNKHLNVLKFTKKIRVYNVQEAVGDLLGSAEAELADADYLLVLVTVNIFNSPQWFELVSQALEQGRRVIPILIEKADYEGTGLERLRSLPSQGRSVSDFPNLDAAYADIVTELKKLLPK